jgi:hypothetical protein
VHARPSGKGRLNGDETFGSGKVKVESGARREVELGLTAFFHNLGICYWSWGRH